MEYLNRQFIVLSSLYAQSAAFVGLATPILLVVQLKNIDDRSACTICHGDVGD
jgi:hypothetical protein